ncbi:hypothetical protein LZ198_14005 [Myxococcus sp. K15C18031901]|uniref:hypothetical protein n=1 Tax=Myxococcus dinghuensis TaxID=2906761 RepID=UPI0020A79861|nr:hypothetical protein [Myxococcus dinghuensis]MCP3099985.1 hypothetical protein [Myxococcus dinghuensis]
MNLKTSLRGLLMLCMAVMAGCGSCQGSGIPDCPSGMEGTNGCECRTGSASCDAGLQCRSGTCVPCGAEGSGCCVTGATTSCSGTLVCVMEADGEICRNCGDVGEACCNSSGSQVCNAGGTCVGGTCQSVAELTCDPNGTTFSVGIQDKNLCALRVVELRAANAANALMCATGSGMLGADDSVFETPNSPIIDYELCVTTAGGGRQTTSVRAFDDFGAMRCATWTRCGDTGCTLITWGACR